jgi:membrane peptidoglycan carboxypeptidase
VESYNFPFYWLANDLGPAKVAEAAHKAGIQYIASPTKIGARVDLSKDESQFKQFGNEIGYGQYGITPLDHANGLATLANDGRYNKAHFVESVQKRDDKTGKFKPFHNEQVKPKQVFDQNVVAAIDNVLQKVPGHNQKDLKDGYHAIGKSGTWEFQDGKSGDNGDAWFIGATRHIAATVWIGREKVNKKKNTVEQQPIFQASGKSMSGGTTPGATWKAFMDLANKVLKEKNDDFLPDVKIGDDQHKGNGIEKPDPPAQNCILGGLICSDAGQNNGGQNNGGQNNGGQTNGGQTNGGQTNGGQNNGGQNNGGQNNTDQPGTNPTNPGAPADPGDDTDQGGGQTNLEN